MSTLEEKVADPLAYVEYDDLVLSMGVEIVDEEDCGYYQGDYVYLVKRGEIHGILVVAYGSCSFCDPLQAADNSVGDVIALRDQLQAEILWPEDGGTLADRVTAKIAASPVWTFDDQTKAAVLRFSGGR